MLEFLVVDSDAAQTVVRAGDRREISPDVVASPVVAAGLAAVAVTQKLIVPCGAGEIVQRRAAFQRIADAVKVGLAVDRIPQPFAERVGVLLYLPIKVRQLLFMSLMASFLLRVLRKNTQAAPQNTSA